MDVMEEAIFVFFYCETANPAAPFLDDDDDDDDDDMTISAV